MGELFRKLMFIMTSIFILFALIGCQERIVHEKIPITKEGEKVIETYLNDKVMRSNFGGPIFSEFEILDTDKTSGKIYIWALIEQCFKDGTEIAVGSGMSVPLVLKVKHEQNSFTITSHSIPRDGADYTNDVKKMFPENIHDKIFEYPSKHIDQLQKQLKIKAKEKLG